MSERAASRDDQLLGQRYILEDLIAEGAFCLVYRALDSHTGQHVALKVLKRVPDAEEAGAREDRFSREVRICRALAHPGLVRLLDDGRTTEGDRFAAFELLDGQTFRERLSANGAMPRDLTVRLMAEVLEGLSAAHASGIVHRDLKPENIMLTGEPPRAVLLDFGAAVGADDPHDILAGTPNYAAPEVLRGERATAQSDLYSWGSILFECLTGRGVIDSLSGHEATTRQLEGSVVEMPPEAFAAGVVQALSRALARDARDRPDSAEALLRDIARSSPALSSMVVAASQASGDERRDVVVVSCSIDASAESASIDGALDECLEHFARLGGLPVSRNNGSVTMAFGLHDGPAPDVDSLAAATLGWVERDPRNVLRWRAAMHAGEVLVESGAGASQRAAYTESLAAVPHDLGRSAPPRRVLVSPAVAAKLPRWSLAQTAEAPSAFRLRRQRTADAPASHHRASFLGRPDEMRALRDAWQSVAAGRTASLLLQGPAGIGKSRLLEEFRAIVDHGDWVEARGTLEGQSGPFHLLGRLVAALGGSAPSLASRYGLDAAESVPLLATLLGEAVPDGYALPLVTPDRFKEITLQVAARLFARAASEEPVVVVLDDLHWADSPTVEFVSVLLAECERAGARLLLLLGARPEFIAPWPSEKIARMEVAPLAADDVERLIRGTSDEVALPPETVESYLKACQGNPLLAEEVAALLRGSAEVSSAVPQNADELLAARLRSVSRDAMAVAQVCAAVGREFRSDLVAEITRQPPANLRTMLRELVEAGLVSSLDDGSYRFRHDLLRDAAYASIPDDDRRQLHQRIATTIREQFPELAMQRPAELALHFERGGEGMTAADYWHQAGTVAMASATYLDALQHFQRGLGLVSLENRSPQRAQRELALTTAVATAHLSTEGFGAATTQSAFARARVMCTSLGREAPLEILGGIFGAALASSDNEETTAILPMFEALATRTDQPMHAFAGHQVLGVHACWSGNYVRAREHTSAAMELYRRRSVRDISWEFGFGLYSFGYGLSAEFQLGNLDRAEEIRHEMLELAESSRNPYCLALALGFSTTLTSDMERPTDTIEQATRLLAIGAEQHLYPWSAFAMCANGQALVQLGRADEGIAPIRAGVSLLSMLGFKCSYGYYLMYLVEALTALGETEEALSVADEALDLYQAHWTRFAEPNMVRLRGAVLEARGDMVGAAAEYRRAIAIAHADRAVSFKFRAERSLSQLLANTLS